MKILSMKNIIISTVITLGMAGTCQALLIDGFLTPQSLIVESTAPSSSGTISASGPEILGNSRELYVVKETGVDGERIRARINPLGEDQLRISTDSATGYTQLTWDGEDNTHGGDGDPVWSWGLGQINLTTDADAFLFGIESSDIGGPITVTVWDGSDFSGNTFATGVLDLTGGVNSLDDTLIATLLFNDFRGVNDVGNSNSEALGILTRVGAIRMTVDATDDAQEGWDLSMSFFGTGIAPVNEPITGILILSGLCALFVTRKRK